MPAIVPAANRSRGVSVTPNASLDARDQRERLQRLAAEVEEVVVDADRRDAQHVLPQSRQRASVASRGATNAPSSAGRGAAFTRATARELAARATRPTASTCGGRSIETVSPGTAWRAARPPR